MIRIRSEYPSLRKHHCNPFLDLALGSLLHALILFLCDTPNPLVFSMKSLELCGVKNLQGVDVPVGKSIRCSVRVCCACAFDLRVQRITLPAGGFHNRQQIFLVGCRRSRCSGLPHGGVMQLLCDHTSLLCFLVNNITKTFLTGIAIGTVEKSAAVSWGVPKNARFTVCLNKM